MNEDKKIEPWPELLALCEEFSAKVGRCYGFQGTTAAYVSLRVKVGHFEFSGIGMTRADALRSVRENIVDGADTVARKHSSAAYQRREAVLSALVKRKALS